MKYSIFTLVLVMGITCWSQTGQCQNYVEPHESQFTKGDYETVKFAWYGLFGSVMGKSPEQEQQMPGEILKGTEIFPILHGIINAINPRAKALGLKPLSCVYTAVCDPQLFDTLDLITGGGYVDFSQPGNIAKGSSPAIAHLTCLKIFIHGHRELFPKLHEQLFPSPQE